MPEANLTHEELVEFATMVFGSTWRDDLASALSISRKNLVLTLASDDPVPENITLPLLTLVEKHLEKQRSKQNEIEKRLNNIRGVLKKPSQPRVLRDRVV